MTNKKKIITKSIVTVGVLAVIMSLSIYNKDNRIDRSIYTYLENSNYYTKIFIMKGNGPVKRENKSDKIFNEFEEFLLKDKIIDDHNFPFWKIGMNVE